MLLSDSGFYYGTYNFEFTSPTLSLPLLPSLKFISIWNIPYYSFPRGYALRNAQRNHRILDSKVQLGYSPFSVLKHRHFGDSQPLKQLYIKEGPWQKTSLERISWKSVVGERWVEGKKKKKNVSYLFIIIYLILSLTSHH